MRRAFVALGAALAAAATLGLFAFRGSNVPAEDENEDDVNTTSWWWRRASTPTDAEDLACEHAYLPARRGTHLEYSVEADPTPLEIAIDCVRVVPTSDGSSVEWRATIRAEGRGEQCVDLRTRCVPGEGAELPLDGIFRAVAQETGLPRFLLHEDLVEGEEWRDSGPVAEGTWERRCQVGGVSTEHIQAGSFDAIELRVDEQLVVGDERIASESTFHLARDVGIVAGHVNGNRVELTAYRTPER